MKGLTKLQKLDIKLEILEVLAKSKKSMSLLDIKKVVEGADRSLVRKLEAEGSIKKLGHHAENSTKQFMHPRTGQLETIGGTYFYTYEITKAIKEDK